MTHSHQLLPALVLTALSVAAPAAAQTSDPGEIQRQVKTGDIVTILDVDGSETRGRLVRIAGGVLELQLITPGEAPNTYQLASGLTEVAIERVAALNRTDPFGGRAELVYQRRDSFGTLAQRLRPGDMVQVTERSGAKTLGRVTGVSPTSLAVQMQTANPRDGSGRPRREWAGSRTFEPRLVEKIERPARLWDGAVKGAAVAAALTLMMTASTCGVGNCPGLAAGYLMTGGIGAGIGLGIDALFPAKRIYRAPKP
jgi:hypothetical protein